MKTSKVLFVVLAFILALFLSVTEGHTWTITAAAGSDGTISPVGAVDVPDGNDQLFTITPDPGYKISNVFVDHSWVGPVSTYNFPNVSINHTITAYFTPLETFYISASVSGSGGTISPIGTTAVTEGNSLQYTITPDTDYGILDVLVDGASVGAVPLYTFPAVSADHSISASFLITNPPTASFVGDPTPLAGDLTPPSGVQFTDTSGLYPTYWFWEFDDGKFSHEQNPLHMFDQPGIYTVTLTVGNALGLDTATLVDDYTVLACGNPDWVWSEQDAGGFSSIMDAYTNSIYTDISLQLKAAPYIEDLLFDTGGIVELKGGYDCTFLGTSWETKIGGTLRIRAGTVKPLDVKISSPMITEYCDGVGNDAAAVAPQCWWQEGVCADNVQQCLGASGWSGPDSPECYSNNPNYEATETLCDGLDNDCDGETDEGLTFDVDGDGSTSIGSCFGSADDCNDNEPMNFPGNSEICDGIDNNCDDIIDPSYDSDGDGYTAATSCSGNADDCNDNDPDINPGATEIYFDDVDQNCDGLDTAAAVDEDCFGCHINHESIPFTYAVHVVAAPDGTCIDCHDAVNNIYTEHYGSIVRTDGNNQTAGATIICETCHDFHNDLYYPNGANVVWAKVVAGQPTLACDTCHENYAPIHDTITAHDNRFSDNSCTSCHAIATAAEVDALHLSDCTLCHDYAGTKFDVATVQQAIQDGMDGTPTYCTACHGADFTAAHPESSVVDHNSLINVGSSECNQCHSDPPPLVDAGDPQVHDACSSCHDTEGVLTPIHGTSSQTFAAGGDCTTCHTGTQEEIHATLSVHPDDAFSWDSNCADCHGAGAGAELVVSEIHNDTCTNCHDTSSSSPDRDNNRVGDPANGIDGDATQAEGTALAAEGDVNEWNTPTCTTCHNPGTYSWESIHTIPIADHTSLVTILATTCGTCHDDTLTSGAANTHNGCASCHNTDGSLVTTLGTDTRTFASGGNCTTCHTGTWVAEHPEPTADHTSLVQAVGGCASCHDDSLVSGAAETHNGCASCHDDNTGALVTTYGTNSQTFTVGGDCTTCHVDTWGTIHAASTPDHSSLVTTTGTTGCANCHEDALTGATNTTHLEDCSNCHDTATGARVTTNGTDSQTFAVGGNCQTCHTGTWEAEHPEPTSDHTSLVTAGASSCNACHDDTLSSAAANTHNACATCHDAGTGALVTTLGTDSQTFGVGGDCTTCHTGTWVAEHPEPTSDHTSLVQVAATGCASCHDDTLISGAPDTHNACATCHNTTTGALVTTLGTDSQTFTTGGDCTTCHASTWGTIHSASTPDHSSLVTITGTTGCANCHEDALTGATNTTHLEDCSNCHDTATGDRVTTNGTDSQTFAVGGNCQTCHTGTWEAEHPEPTADHTSLVTVAATSCGNCHDDTLSSAAADTHNACATCHDAGTGALVTTLGTDSQTFGVGGDCTTCHTGTWVAEHPEPTSDHTSLVQVAATGCASCHNDTLVSGAPDTHNACATCHNFTTGALVTTLGTDSQTFAVGGDCTTCHIDTWGTIHTAPDHSSLVTTSGTTGCANCHEDALTGATNTTHLEDCSNCHDTATGARVTTNGTDSQTFAVGGNCQTCHTGTWEAEHPEPTADHTSLVTVGASTCASCHDDTLISAATDTHNACATCHNATTGALVTTLGTDSQTFAVGGDCTTCHGTVWEDIHSTPDHSSLVTTSGTAGCANCHDDTLVSSDPLTHLLDCSNCHDGNGDLVTTLGTNSQTFAAGGNCQTCHTGTWEAEHSAPTADHTSLVTAGASSCASCHDDTLASGATDTHNGCASCHNTNGDLVTTNGTNSQTFAVGGDCTTCHTGTWEAEHPEPTADHTSLVQVAATGCASCHNDTLVSGAPDTHNACATCHNATTGALVTTLGTNSQTFAVGGDCTTCHASTWGTIHSASAPDHSSLVTTAGTTGCANCHDDTLVSSANNTHLSDCSNCHDTATGARVTTLGTDSQSFGVGGNCQTCHTGTWEAEHPEPTSDHTSLVTVAATSCAACHDDTLSSAAADTHNACATCHDSGTGALVTTLGTDSQTFGVGGDCTTCHTGTWVAEHPEPTADHTSLVQVAATGCASCHNNTLVSGAPETHNGCASCHDDNTGALVTTYSTNSQTFALGGDCTTCHVDTWGTIHAASTPDHSSLVTTTGTTGCANCHDDTLASSANNTHLSDCSNCHDTATGARVTTLGTSSQSFGVGGNCQTCHTGTWEAEHPEPTSDHTSLVTVAATSCSNCHGDTLVSGASDTHNACATCHDAGTGALVTTLGTDSQTFGVGGDCTTCHTGTWVAEHPEPTADHTSLVQVAATGCASCHNNTLVSGAPETHNGCASCHDDNTGALVTTYSTNSQTFALGGDCTTCHADTWGTIHAASTPDHSSLVTTTGTTNCANCHDDTLVSSANNTHLSDCSNCHDTATGARVTTLGTSSQSFGVGGNCQTCHTGTWEAEHPEPTSDHTSLVTVAATSCAACHDDTLSSAAADTHNACATCHDAGTGALVTTLGTDSQTFGVGGDCTTCHTGTWVAEHPEPTADHTSLVQVAATGCASCHNNTLVSGAPETHNGCASCHDDNTGALVTTYSTNSQTFALGGDCTTCHVDTWGTIHAASTPDHSSLVTTTGTTGCASCHDDTLVSSANNTHLSDCSNCHDTATGARVTTLGTSSQSFGVGGNCQTCHTGTWEAEHPEPTSDHTSLVTVGASSCATCHNDTLVSVDPDTHDGCATCHNASTGALVTTNGTDSQTFALGGDCTTCHTGTWEAEHTTDPGHTGITVGATTCGTCHDDTLVSGAANTHDACISCHDSADGSLVGSAIGNPTPTDCTTCHTGTWEAEHPEPTSDHTSLVTVAATSCGNCHGDTLVSGAADTHNACATCHDAGTGALVTTLGTSSQTFAVGGDCTTCHTGTWEAEHPEPTSDHTSLVTVAATSCSNCHGDTLVSGAADTHNACATCHNASTGALVTTLGTSSQTFAVGGDCTTCHTGTWEAEHPEPTSDHTSLVTVGATGCASCHNDTLVSGAPDTHNACATCHNASTGALVTTLGTSSQTFAVGGDCTTCHIDTWGTIHTAPDHSSLVTTTGTTGCANCHEDALTGATNTTHLEDCSNCHDTATGARVTTNGTDSQTFAAGGNCQTCHTGTWEAEHPEPTADHTSLVTVAATSCGNCHGDTLVSGAADTHNACATCHNASTGALVTTLGTDSQTFAVGGDCTTCHTGTWEAEHPEPTSDHTSLVTVAATSCSNCHGDTLVSGAADTHNACATCHNASTGALVTTLGTSSQTFATGGDCTTCHTGTWEAEHPEPTADHTSLVTVAVTSCSNCHGDTLVSGAADTHNACASCHNASTGALVTTLGTSSQTFATGGDCTTCHTGTWEAEHPEPTSDHTSLVTAAGGCATCHTDILVSVDPDTHDGCATCHNASTGALVTTNGTDSQTFATGGDCTTCHTGTWEAEHTTDPGHTGITVGATTCGTCHDDTLVSGAANTHDACISCHDSADGSLVGSANGNPSPTDCTTCHTGTWEAEHPEPTADHTSLVTVGATGCGPCHNDTLVSVDPDTHTACASCHNAGTGALVTTYGTNIQTFAGGGDCTTCHTDTWETIHPTTSNDHTSLVTVTGTDGGSGGMGYCGACHSDPPPLVDPVDFLVHDACTSCHSATTGALVTTHGTNNQTLAAGGNCDTCHVNKASHGDHDGSHILYSSTIPGCQSCHITDTGASGVHSANSCDNCHTALPPALRTTPTPLSQYAYAIPAGSGQTCEVCHNGHDIVEEILVDVAQNPPQMCGECHGGRDKRFSDFSEIKILHYNHCATCHDSTDPLVTTTVNQYDGVANEVNCTDCHGTVAPHTGHPNIIAGIRGSAYADPALGTQTFSCFTAGCHASNTVTEHLSPRGIAYKNYENKYGQQFTCEMCHENSYPVEVMRAGYVCSDPDYKTQGECETNYPKWRPSTGDCSDPAWTNQGDCETNYPTWDPIVYNSDPVINAAIVLGIGVDVPGEPVYCSDCHKEDIERHDRGVCSDSQFVNEVECTLSCSNPIYTTQVECLLNGATWDVPTSNTWTPEGYCTDIRFTDEASCEPGGTGVPPVWFPVTQNCSDPQHTTQNDCETAVTLSEWRNIMPYSIHGKYNGVGIYSFSERHHQADVWEGTCSNTGITDEGACYADGSTWTPTYTEGDSYVARGDCTACHKDPRERPYDRNVCQNDTPATATACISAGLATYGGSCSLSEYLNTYECTDNGGTWSGGVCLDYQYEDETACLADPDNTSWVPHPAGASKALPSPKQMPCVDCHAKVDATGGTMTIYRKKNGTQIDPYGTYGGWVRTETGHIANTVDHVCADDRYTDETTCNAQPDHSWYEPLGICEDTTITDRASCDPDPDHHWETPCSDNAYDDHDTCVIVNGGSWEGVEHKWPVTSGNIDNYGACLFCHKMRPYHSYPGPPPEDTNKDVVDSDFYDDGYADPAHYPCYGRGSLTVFFGSHRKPFQYYTNPAGQNPFKNEYKAIRDLDALPDDTISWWSNVIYDPQTDPNGMVPTTSFCSDPSLLTKSACESANPVQWWRPGHVMGTPEYFTVPVFDPPINNTVDLIVSMQGTSYTSNSQTIDVVAKVDQASTGTVYAVWAGKAKPMIITDTKQGNNTWEVTFDANDGVIDLGDSAAGRVYVINVDESGDNHDLLAQEFTDL